MGCDLSADLKLIDEALQGLGPRDHQNAALVATEYVAEVASVAGHKPIAPCIDGRSQDRRVFGHDLRD
jgi:hypothetical protein